MMNLCVWFWLCGMFSFDLFAPQPGFDAKESAHTHTHSWNAHEADNHFFSFNKAEIMDDNAFI